MNYSHSLPDEPGHSVMPRRWYRPTDEQYERIVHHLPEVEGRDCPSDDHRKVVNGIFWILRSRVPRKNMPEWYGNWKTVYDQFRRWAEDGTLESIARHLQGELDAEGHIDWFQFNVESIIVQAGRVAAGGPIGDTKGPNQAR